MKQFHAEALALGHFQCFVAMVYGMLIPADNADYWALCVATARDAARLDEEFIAEWQALARSNTDSNPFLEPWFALPALRYLRDEERIWLVEVRAEGRLIGIHLLAVQQGYGRMPVRHIGNWAHYQCFMGTPLVRKGHERGFWTALLTLLNAADWAPNFLSLTGLDGHSSAVHALMMVARQATIVHRQERAILSSDLNADAYLEQALKSKKRKELRRLSARLAETGDVRFRCLADEDSLEEWCHAFLDLEASGWKGSDGAAFGNDTQTRHFFLEVMAGARAAGRLDFQRLDLDGRAIAMLINFLTPPGSWSFKIAFDEDFARFSPGVMIELENLPRVLGHPDLDWMDSCAAQNHPMIDRLWRERREIVQVTVPLAGVRRRAVHAICRAAEAGSALMRTWRNKAYTKEDRND